MRKKEATRRSGNPQHLSIGQSDHAAIVRAEAIECRLSSAESRYDAIIEVGVRLKGNPHAMRSRLCRAPSSLA